MFYSKNSMKLAENSDVGNRLPGVKSESSWGSEVHSSLKMDDKALVRGGRCGHLGSKCLHSVCARPWVDCHRCRGRL